MIAITVALLVVGSLACSERQREPIEILLPEDFTGWACICFRKPGADPLQVANGRLVVRIPDSGIVETSTIFGHSLDTSDEFYRMIGGDRHRVKAGWVDGSEIRGVQSRLSRLLDHDLVMVDAGFFVGSREQWEQRGHGRYVREVEWNRCDRAYDDLGLRETNFLVEGKDPWKPRVEVTIDDPRGTVDDMPARLLDHPEFIGDMVKAISERAPADALMARQLEELLEDPSSRERIREQILHDNPELEARRPSAGPLTLDLFGTRSLIVLMTMEATSLWQSESEVRGRTGGDTIRVLFLDLPQDENAGWSVPAMTIRVGEVGGPIVFDLGELLSKYLKPSEAGEIVEADLDREFDELLGLFEHELSHQRLGLQFPEAPKNRLAATLEDYGLGDLDWDVGMWRVLDELRAYTYQATQGGARVVFDEAFECTFKIHRISTPSVRAHQIAKELMIYLLLDHLRYEDWVVDRGLVSQDDLPRRRRAWIESYEDRRVYVRGHGIRKHNRPAEGTYYEHAREFFGTLTSRELTEFARILYLDAGRGFGFGKDVPDFDGMELHLPQDVRDYVRSTLGVGEASGEADLARATQH